MQARAYEQEQEQGGGTPSPRSSGDRVVSDEAMLANLASSGHI